MNHILGGADMDASGPVGVCAGCGGQGRMHVHSAEGWLCRRCFLGASTVMEIRVINGKRFHRSLKSTATAGSARIARVG